MRIALGADHGGFDLKNKIANYLKENKYEVIDFGTNSSVSVNYPDFAKMVGNAIIKKEADFGILICGTGIGISIAANKIKGIRCALSTNTTMARLSREHNNANILALGSRIVGELLALEMVEIFLSTPFQDERHLIRINMLED